MAAIDSGRSVGYPNWATKHTKLSIRINVKREALMLALQRSFGKKPVWTKNVNNSLALF